MRDVIVHIPDFKAVLEEAGRHKHLAVRDMDEKVIDINIDHTPYIEKDGERLALFRVRDDDYNLLSEFKSVKLLGDYKTMKMSPVASKAYNRIYDRTPKTAYDEELKANITYTPPEQFGVFYDLNEEGK